MEDYHVKLVVPFSLVNSYPEEYRDKISDIKTFISTVKEKQSHIPQHFLLQQ